MKKLLQFGLISALAVLILDLSACGLIAPKTSARLRAWPHVHPVISALSKYNQSRNQYPDSLAELYPDYTDKELKLNHSTEYGGVWDIEYEKKNDHLYQLKYFHVHYNVTYENGEAVNANSNPFQ